LIRFKKHIAYLLFGIFFFPILFQSVHIVWHKSKANKNEHHCCHSEACDKDSSEKTENISQKEDVCQICEFHFSLNDLPTISIFSSVIPAFTCSLNVETSRQYYRQDLIKKSPRAPPIFIS
jgi:hypothetical protein